MINRVIIDGRLGKDPEIRKTPNGKSVCNISIAQSKKDQNAEWFNIIAWERTADFLGQYCKKGDVILVEGHMKYKEWETEGKRRSSQDIIADTITLERRGNNHSEPMQAPRYEQKQQYAEPQQTYNQQSMVTGANVPANLGYSDQNDYIDVNPDDLPF